MKVLAHICVCVKGLTVVSSLITGKVASDNVDVCVQKQLERFEWQLRILKQVLSANGAQERAELLKDHSHDELFAIIQNFTEKVRRE